MHLNGTTSPPAVSLLQRITGLRTGFPDFQVTVDDVLADGDKVALRLTIHGTHRGEVRSANRILPATGKRVTNVGIMVLQIADARVVEEWTVADVLGMLQQLDALPL